MLELGLKILWGASRQTTRFLKWQSTSATTTPLRVLLYANEERKMCLEYDKPSSLFGQFGNERITPIAALLERKLEALITAAIR
jgi:hypothetical protein